MILLVDDSPTIRQILKIYLMGRPFEFLEADNGERALQLVKLMPVELVIADVKMPGMDGLSFVKELRAGAGARKNLPVILLTGEKSDDIRDQGMRAGANAFLQKPVSSSRLKDLVNELLPPKSA